ncbi:hypothetical protein Scel_09450 [Streptomyces cellostaticus]|nr:hypothetical protein Scel_09450 [Streptomyces cellostaticus]
MPCAERPLDLDTGPLTRFAADLRKLREAAGRLGHYAHFMPEAGSPGRSALELAVECKANERLGLGRC